MKGISPLSCAVTPNSGSEFSGRYETHIIKQSLLLNCSSGSTIEGGFPLIIFANFL